MNDSIEKYSKLFEHFSPVSVIPSRYDSTNIVLNEKQVKEDMNNILRIIPVFHPIAVKLSRGKPYTITAILLDEQKKPTNIEIHLVFFAGNASWWSKLYPLHTILTIIGRPKTSKNIISFVHPKKIENDNDFFNTKQQSTISAVYRKHGVKILDSTIQKQMSKMIESIPELSQKVSQLINFHLGITSKLTLRESLQEVHQPSSIQKLEEAKKFLATLEYISYKSTLQKINHHKATALNFKTILPDLQKFFHHPLTNGQKEGIVAIEKFQQTPKGKLFLLQGDVGCGKTIVAINSAINAVNAGFQVAVLAPTQILAMQLFHNFHQALSHFNIQCELLISKEKTKTKREKLINLQNGDIHVVVGTHAVFSKSVEFQNLGFVIIDEQHKFGVLQRLELMKKSQNAKCLLMTATPIPRTLSMSMYSGIEYYSIKEKPHNRLPINTSVLPAKKAGEILSSAKNRFGNDFKMYWVCPLIEAESEVKSNIKEREKFLLKYFKQEEIITVHGKMKEDTINDAILNFKENPNIRILLATTIVEVGIDVPKANIIVIESAETFGLASLHQLRGRVGRSTEQGYCILLFDGNLSQNAITRLQAMKQSSDGFHISEIDRKLRGSGNILGNVQSGTMHFNFFDENNHQTSITQMEEISLNILPEEKEKIANIFQANTSIEFSFN